MFRCQVLVCGGGACMSAGCKDLVAALMAEIENHGLQDEIKVVQTGCIGSCDLGPIITVYPEGVFYQRLKPEDAVDIVTSHLMKGEVVERLLYHEPVTEKAIPLLADIDFFKYQEKIVLRNCGLIDPTNIEEYIGRDGYMALAKCLKELTPQQVIDEVKKSGLRGRGGAGFLTGMKWQFTHDATGSPKYVLCNADEGDPGAFMDRSVLEGDPHSIIEAMAIAAYAIGGCDKGYIYVRAEYPLAIERLEIALAQARETGMLGDNILGTGFKFDLQLRMGAGAFVCGEETALMRSIEGKRGEPRPRPPFPAAQGLWEKPTLLNNVETYANIAPIITKGADWFAGFGTEKSTGTKVFALAGHINNTGLVEVPMGTPLGKIIYDIGGGVRHGKGYKAAQTGGPSGGCIPRDQLNVPMEYEALVALGSIMGSGGLIVMDEDTCMVDLARFFLDFVQDESCGKCPPCRIGTKRMLEILTRITKGQGRRGDVELLIELGEQIKASALCGLGQTAPNPVLSTIRYFRNEYDEHILNKHCTAAVCHSLMRTPCQSACPVGVDIAKYVSLIAAGDFDNAFGTIMASNPLPGICGRICTHSCESKCRRQDLDDPVAIRMLKRVAADNRSKDWRPVVAEDLGKRVAVIGAGPAGLMAAWQLRQKGYGVTIFEKFTQPGGMMLSCIPAYRLPREILAEEIDTLLSIGIDLKTGVEFGKDVTLDSLKADGYEATFLGIGCNKGMTLDIPGGTLPGVIDGVTFLNDHNLRGNASVGRKVAVIGGGDVAIDAARVALRLGVEEVSVVYRRTRDEMPAHEQEIADAEAEGVQMHYLVAPTLVKGNGQVEALRCQRMQLGEFDKSGRRRPEAIPGTEFDLPVDTIILAIGQSPDAPWAEGLGLETTRQGTLVVNPVTMATSLDGVFAGGDFTTGPSTVIEAMSDGAQAAMGIHSYLSGEAVPEPSVPQRTFVTEQEAEMIEGTLLQEVTPRTCVTCMSVTERINGFGEVEQAFAVEVAMREARRCLRCDLAPVEPAMKV